MWYSRSREIAGGRDGKGQGTGMIENGTAEERLLEGNGDRTVDDGGGEKESGILLGSTLAALKQSTNGAFGAPAKPAPSGPLVAYSSDDDSD